MAQEFVSKLEEIMPAEELLFNPTPAFGKYRAIMPEEAAQHPAKFNTNLVEFLIKTYTKPGDVILDCMAGTGILGVIAALHGRHAIQVEIEEKFFRWMEKARENVERLCTLTLKGKIINICGDARRLSELLSLVDTIITSPPYSETLSVGAGGGSKKNALGVGITSDGKSQAQGAPIPYSMNPDNIGNLPLGNIDTIITSPPYSSQWGVADKNRPKATFEREKRYRENHPELKGKRPPLPGAYSDSMENIGNLPLGNIDAIITSPPYDGSLEGTSRHTRGGIASRDPALAQTGTYADVICHSLNPENIGNLKSSDEEYETLAKGLMTKDGKPTYLSEMLKVYRECYKVLRPGGLAIIVVKAFIRNKKPIDLPYHSHILLSSCGFRLEKLYKLRLKSQSFWRILYAKKHPEVPIINHEYILIYRKP